MLHKPSTADPNGVEKVVVGVQRRVLLLVGVALGEGLALVVVCLEGRWAHRKGGMMLKTMVIIIIIIIVIVIIIIILTIGIWPSDLFTTPKRVTMYQRRVM